MKNMRLDINRIVADAHDNAKQKGFWDESNNNSSDLVVVNKLALVMTEVAEALEALRMGDRNELRGELADIVIRVADLAGFLKIDLESAIMGKMLKNKERPYLHGKSFG